MQGRLLPTLNGRLQGFPAGRWREEFDIAARLGLSSIEWIYEEANKSSNPLAAGRIEDIQEAMEATAVRVPSICADYFMDHPWIRADRRGRQDLSGTLVWLVECAASLGARYVDVPFVDNSSLAEWKRLADVREFVKPALDLAAERGIFVCLETDLEPAGLRSLLESLAHPAVAVCYDSGNSASLDHDPREEFEVYGNRIRTVHVKDRLRGGGTVPLGTGNTNFAVLFEQLEAEGYGGPLILQAARGDDYIQAAIHSLEFVREYVKRDGRRC